ncbi:MAG: hypothetical protein HXY50_17155 [Ignavibacteriaceae bacterium]|nr:hypothetical protein [Ignavibacteriaceae bacterium]
MNAALAAWNGRIAPVFDVVGQIRLLRIDSGRVVDEAEEAVEGLTPAEKALRLAKLGVDLLICGAISRPIQVMVEAYGIRVVPFVTGDVPGVIQALVEDRLADAVRAMPGCRGGGRRGRPRNRGFREERTIMDGESKSAGGGGSGKGRGQGRSTGGRGGRMAGGFSKGPGGRCVCPACGHEEPHKQGVPCSQTRCPDCGSVLIRR